MTARHYITDHGVPVFVEVSTDADRVEVERELRRIYGASYRLGRFVRRGKRQRASVEKINDVHIQGATPGIGALAEKVNDSHIIRAARKANGWLGGVP